MFMYQRYRFCLCFYCLSVRFCTCSGSVVIFFYSFYANKLESRSMAYLLTTDLPSPRAYCIRCAYPAKQFELLCRCASSILNKNTNGVNLIGFTQYISLPYCSSIVSSLHMLLNVKDSKDKTLWIEVFIKVFYICFAKIQF